MAITIRTPDPNPQCHTFPIYDITRGKGEAKR